MALARRAATSILSQRTCHQTLVSGSRCFFTRTTQRPQTLPSISVQNTISPKRWHSAPASQSKQYEFAQIKELSQQPSKERILIDVREPNEYQAGYIPTAINIPVKTNPDAYFLPEEEFEDRFGFEKPSTDKEVVFYCRSGVRSSAAAQLAQQHGYKNVSEYRGSWLDWEKQGGAASKP